MQGKLFVGLVSFILCAQVMANDWPEEIPGSVSDRPHLAKKTASISNPDLNKNLLVNADFEEGTAHWILAKHRGARATYYLDTLNTLEGHHSAAINVYSSTGNKSDIQLLQRFPVQKLTEYFITFSAAVTEETRIAVSVFNDSDILWSEEITLLKGQHMYGPIRFSNHITDAFTMLGFELGESKAQLHLDNLFTWQDSSALAFEKVKGQTGLNVYFQQKGVALVQIPIAQTEDVPIIVSDGMGRLIAFETFRAGSTSVELILDKKYGERKDLIFTVYLGDVIMTRHVAMVEMVTKSNR